MSRETLTLVEPQFDPRSVAEKHYEGLINIHPRGKNQSSGEAIEDLMRELHGVDQRNLLSALSTNYLDQIRAPFVHPSEAQSAVVQYLRSLSKVRKFDPDKIAPIYMQDTQGVSEETSINNKAEIIAAVYTGDELDSGKFIETATIGYETERLVGECYQELYDYEQVSIGLRDQTIAQYTDYYESLCEILQATGIDNRIYK